MIKVEVRENHHIDVFMAEAMGLERLEEYVLWLDNPKTLSQLRLKKGPDPRLDENAPSRRLFHQESPATERYTVLVINIDPAGPEGLGGIAKHSPPVEPL
jgi:hypothetical protein